MSRVNYIEIDLPVCQLSYGNSPCTAQIGVTGSRKCFNTLATCQDTDNIDLEDQVIRFSTPSIDNTPDIKSIPSIASVSYTPPKIMLGEGIGARSSITVTFRDHPTPDTGPGGDPYYIERTYDPYKQGTFWGKFSARYKFLRGVLVRWYSGDSREPLEGLQKRVFILDSIEGPNTSGQVKIVAKDPLSLLDSKRARAPFVSRGTLASDITDTTSTLLLNPSGIVAEDYDRTTPYYISVSGEEVMQVTAVDTATDELTVQRAQYGTDAIEHDAEERVQVALYYESERPHLIIYNLFSVYGNIPIFYMLASTDWADEISNFLDTLDTPALYTALITEPTGVVDLVNELCEQAGISLWWDDIKKTIRLQVLRFAPISGFAYDDNIMLAGSFRQKEQPGKRVSQAWVYYSQDNPLENLEEPANYREALVQQSSQSAFRYGTPSVKQIFSRWIPKGGFDVAAKVAQLILARFAEPPREFNFTLLRSPLMLDPELGEAVRLRSQFIQDDTGAVQDLDCQITAIKATDSTYQCTAEEITRSDYDQIQNEPDVILVTVTADTLNLNLRSLFDSIRSMDDVQPDDEIRFEIRSNVRIGSNTFGSAMRTGDWSDLPTGAFITLSIFGGAVVAGKAGEPGTSAIGETQIATQSEVDAGPGGQGFLVEYPITVTNNGVIGGGGGGGGGAAARSEGSATINVTAYCCSAAGGGGGAGYPTKLGGDAVFIGGSSSTPSDVTQDIKDGRSGTEEDGGASRTAESEATTLDGTIYARAISGAGGDLGQDGSDGSFQLQSYTGYEIGIAGQGGAAGRAIQGVSDITWDVQGDIRGATV